MRISWSQKQFESVRAELAADKVAGDTAATIAALEQHVTGQTTTENSLHVYLASLTLLDHLLSQVRVDSDRVDQLLKHADELAQLAKINSPRSKLYHEWLEWEYQAVRWEWRSRPSLALAMRLQQSIGLAKTPQANIVAQAHLLIGDIILHDGGGQSALPFYETVSNHAADPQLKTKGWLGALRCMRLTGHRSEAAYALDVARAKMTAESFDVQWQWEEAVLAAHDPRQLNSIASFLQSFHGEDPSFLYRATAYIYGVSDKPEKQAPLKAKTIRRKYPGQQAIGSSEYHLFRSVLALEDATDTGTAAQQRIDRLIQAIADAEAVRNVEDKLIIYRGLFKMLRRLNKLDLAQNLENRYVRLSLGLSGGDRDDVLALGSALKPVQQLKGQHDSLDNGSWSFIKDTGFALAKMATFSTKVTLQGLSSPLNQSAKERHQRALAQELIQVIDARKGPIVKLGQMIAFIDSPFGEVIRQEFSVLQADVKPMTDRITERVFEREFGRKPQDVFASWNSKAVAAGSVGQVHKARLHTGELVAVKLQYPGVEELVQADLDRAAALNFLFKRLFPNMDLDAISAELRQQILSETNYLLERYHNEWFREAWRKHPQISIPKTYPEYSSRRVLTVDWVEGDNILEFGKKVPQAQRNEVAELLAWFTLGSKSTLSAFNADPHPGNFIVTLGPDGRPILHAIDFGNVKTFTPDYHAKRERMLAAFLDDDQTGFTRAFCDLGFLDDSAEVDPEILYQAFTVTMGPYLQAGSSKFTKEFLKQRQDMLAGAHPYADRLKLPADHLFVLRYDIDVHHILVELNAEFDARRVLAESLNRSGESESPRVQSIAS